MGFYGNITNTNKTQFTFDRTYPNRKTMEARLATDEIYLGRYVLIEYDTDGAHTLDTYLKCYVKTGTSGEEFYTSPNFDAKTRVKWSKANAAGEPSIAGTVITGELIYVEKDLTPEDKNIAISQVFYKCINDNNSDNGDIAEFKLISASESNYTKNYNIDTAIYGEGRGYDSTVWQKVYTQGTEKYVMIAELNSVVPTFDLSADAPTMEPITPHFDADSTNVYYKLHWQPAWGFRIAKASDTNSDAEVVWSHSSYDPITDKINTSTENVAGAINFNEPGFSETTPNVDNSENYITVLPTGLSGKNYNTHDGTGILKPAPDIQEMKINLPAIGNMMSKAWDIIHGTERNDSPADSLQGRLDFFTKEINKDEIPVQHQNGYLVGAHMEDDKWISTNIDAATKTITINHTFNEGEHTTANQDINDNGDTINLYSPEVDEMGHVIGETTTTVTLPYGYKTITTNGRGSSTEINTDDNLNTANVIADNTQDSLAVNSGNKWIRIDTDSENDSLTISHDIHSIDIVDETGTNLNDGTDTITIQDISHDGAGHITANKDHTYTLPYGYKIIIPGEISEKLVEIESNTEPIIADNTQDSLTIAPGNKWIRIAGDEDNDTLTIAHEVHDISETEIPNSDLDGVGEFTVQDLQFDKAGHVIANQKHKYTLPNAIRNIDVAGSDAITAGTTTAGKVEADSYNDTLTLNAQNRWVNLKVNDDTISIGHAAAGNENTTAGDTVASTPDFGATFNVPYIKYDEMGHIASSNTRTVKIPQGKLTDTLSTQETANVLTSIEFTPATGAITTEHKNVGALKLTDYSAVNANNAYVQSTDTINTAFEKMDSRIDSVNESLISKINNLDYTDTPDTDKVIYSISQTDGKISLERKAVGELIISGYTKPTSISAGVSTSDTINTAIGKLDYSLEKEIDRAEKAESDLSAKIDKAITDLDVNAITTDEYSVIDSVSETDGKISATTKYLSGIKLQGYSTGTNTADVAADDTVNTAFGKLQAQINATDKAVEALTNGTSTEEIDSVMELVKWTEEHGNTTQGIINTIGQQAEGETSSTGIYALIDAEAAARTLANENINKRIDGLAATTITTDQITQWNKAEENIQSDWNQTDTTADDFIKNKPTDLVRTSDIANMVETTTAFIYTQEIKDETSGEIITPEETITIAQLIEKIKVLEARIIELEAKHAEQSNGEETPTE